MNSIISNSHITAVINHQGAELQSLVSDGLEHMWEGNPKWWGKHAPILFPIVGSLKEGTYKHGDQTFKMGRHGFARDMLFEVTEHTDNSVTLQLEDSPDSISRYPFQFCLRITFALSGRNLNTTYHVTNKGTEEMHFSIGAHPAFGLSKTFDEYSLQFEQPGNPEVTFLENGLLTNNASILETNSGLLQLNYSLFENDALVICGSASRSLTLNHLQRPILTVDFEDFPDLGLWTIPGAAFICIEPWFGYSDSFEVSGQLKEKPGIVHLMPKQEFNSTFTIIIH